MSKQHKKLRQLYSRALEKEAQKQVMKWNEVIKPKPKYMPTFLYKYMLKTILK